MASKCDSGRGRGAGCPRVRRAVGLCCPWRDGGTVARCRSTAVPGPPGTPSSVPVPSFFLRASATQCQWLLYDQALPGHHLPPPQCLLPPPHAVGTARWHRARQPHGHPRDTGTQLGAAAPSPRCPLEQEVSGSTEEHFPTAAINIHSLLLIFHVLFCHIQFYFNFPL